LTKPGVSYRCGFFGPAERILFAQGHRIEHVPGGFRQFAPILERFAPRIMVAQAAPPDAEGRVNLSLHYGATRPELLRAGRDHDRLLIIETNPNLPRTRSHLPEFDNTIPVDVITCSSKLTASRSPSRIPHPTGAIVPSQAMPCDL